MAKYLQLGLLLVCPIVSYTQDTKPVETMTYLQAEIQALKAELVLVKLEAQYQIQVCQMPDLMAAKLNLKTNEKVAEDLKTKKVPEHKVTSVPTAGKQ